jgi:hypothetical protein
MNELTKIEKRNIESEVCGKKKIKNNNIKNGISI